MKEADNILDSEALRYMLDGDLVVVAIAALEFRFLRLVDDDHLHYEHVRLRICDGADKFIVDKDVGLPGPSDADCRKHEYGGKVRADSPRVELRVPRREVTGARRHQDWIVPQDALEIGKYCAHDVASPYLVCRHLRALALVT
jgi:hypothetical protein